MEEKIVHRLQGKSGLAIKYLLRSIAEGYRSLNSDERASEGYSVRMLQEAIVDGYPITGVSSSSHRPKVTMITGDLAGIGDTGMTENVG